MHAHSSVIIANLPNLRGTEGYSYLWVPGIQPISFRQDSYPKLFGKELELNYTLAKKSINWYCMGVRLLHYFA